jgi:gamma-glutamylcyclotransferase (GGCT)/AIG2-like uncharacterized protein YtfP
MDGALQTDDLDLDAVQTLDDLADLLCQVRTRAGEPSLRDLEARTRSEPTFVSKTVAGEILGGTRFPKMAVLVALLQACGVPGGDLQPWRQAWERLATSQRPKARREAVQTTPEAKQRTDDGIETSRLQEQVSQLTADNERLRQLLENSAISSPQTLAGGQPRTTSYPAMQEGGIQYFALEDDLNSEQLFYNELAEHVRNAKGEVFVLGKGFHDDWKSPVYDSLIQAENEALSHGVRMIRIHTGDLVADRWAQGYARLLKHFPHTFTMLADLDEVSDIDVILIDPRGRDPVVSFIFESREEVELGFVGSAISALLIKNARSLAKNLATHFRNHSNRGLEKITSRSVLELATTKMYFAWGVHMYSGKMLRDVPGASYRGTAILRGWHRNIEAMLAGPAYEATIEPDEQDAFDGVAYELSWSGKARLDRLEKRAYREEEVNIELDDGRRLSAFTYIPLPKPTKSKRLESGSWMDLVVEGARERKMYGLLAQLRDAGAPIDINRL